MVLPNPLSQFYYFLGVCRSFSTPSPFSSVSNFQFVSSFQFILLSCDFPTLWAVMESSKRRITSWLKVHVASQSPSLIQLLELIFSQWFDLKHSMKLIVLYCPNKLEVPSWSSISLIEREISAVHVKCLSVWREAGSAGVLSSHIPGYIIGQRMTLYSNRTEKPGSWPKSEVISVE